MRILHLELRPGYPLGIQTVLQSWEHHCIQGLTPALDLLREIEPELILLDIGSNSAITEAPTPVQALSQVLDLCSGSRVLVVGAVEDGVLQELLHLGAFDVVTHPQEGEHLQYAIERALRFARLEPRDVTAKGRRRLVEVVPGIFTSDPTLRRIARRTERLASADVRVILQGETGTGRKTIARLLGLGRKGLSAAHAPQVAFNSQLPGSLGGTGSGSKMVLAGNVSPSATLLPPLLLCSASSRASDIDEFLDPARIGLGRLSTGARNAEVIILESVDELGPELQAVLLRRLVDLDQRRQERPIPRIVSLATAQFGKRIAEGTFRRDLYDRLAEVHLCLPPLRSRGRDTLELAELFLGRYQQALGRHRLQLSDAAVEAIRDHDWPGNVAELSNAIKQAVITAEGPQIMPNDLTLPLGSGTRLISLREAREYAERDAVQRALKRANGNIARASESLGISRPTLYDLLTKLRMR